MKNHRAQALALLGIIVIWSTWQCFKLTNLSILGDHEMWYWHDWDWETLREYFMLTDKLESNGIIVQLFHHVLWDKLFSSLTPIGLRFPSIVANCLSLVLVYLIGKDVSGRRVGILGVFFLATSALQFGIAVHCRFYSASTFFMLLSLWLLIRICRHPSPKLWVLYALAWLGSLTSMVLNLLLLPGHIILYLACAPKGKAKYAKASGIIVICAVIFGALCLRDPDAVNRFNYPSTWGQWKQVAFTLLSQGFIYGNSFFANCFGIGYKQYLDWQVTVSAVLLLSLFGYELIASVRQRQCRYTLFAPLLMMGYALSWVAISVTIKPLTLVSNTSSIWPLISIALAQALGGSKFFSQICRLVFLLLLFNNIPLIYTEPLINIRDTTQFIYVIRNYCRPSDVIIIQNHGVIDPYYFSGYTNRDFCDASAIRLLNMMRFWKDTTKKQEIRPKQLSATTKSLPSMCALAYENSHPGQRFWVIARINENSPAKIHDYLKWYTGRDVKCLTNDSSDVFVVFFVKYAH